MSWLSKTWTVTSGQSISTEVRLRLPDWSLSGQNMAQKLGLGSLNGVWFSFFLSILNPYREVIAESFCSPTTARFKATPLIYPGTMPSSSVL